MLHDGLTKEEISLAFRKLGYVCLASLFVIFVLSIRSAVASTTLGTIDSTNRYAYEENAGWLDFGASGGAVQVSDTALTGYAYGGNIGWVSLNCSNTSSCGTVNYAVVNDGNGNLSGYAYGENIGWIDFHPSAAGVTIDSSGVFHGSAYGGNIGWITFNCADTSSCGTVNYTVSTDWRPASARTSPPPTVAPSSGGGGGGLGSNYVWPTNTSTTSTPTNFQPANCPPGDLYSTVSGLRCPSSSSTTTTSLSSSPLNMSLFTRDLTLRSNGEDVRALQVFLNGQGFSVSLTGAGSKGNESTYFGAKTKLALSKWQKAHGIGPASGYFGPKTRSAIKTLNI